MTVKKNKTVQLTARIAENDMRRKAAQAAKFANKGLGVNVSLKLRGREEQHKDRAIQTLTTFLEATGTPSTKVSEPKWNSALVLSTFIHPWEAS
tara:strand:+ start:113 stop:394 length:282 start_codon:yes stop_codon:yes gene_type:complete